MFDERTSVGLDVHARSVAAAAFDGQTGEVVKARLTPAYAEVLAWSDTIHGNCSPFRTPVINNQKINLFHDPFCYQF